MMFYISSLTSQSCYFALLNFLQIQNFGPFPGYLWCHIYPGLAGEYVPTKTKTK